ncbi:retinoblastoma-associated protein [Coregonus clupeaformis]|uniref:retinoblastoma-associated protein n=1 Tax=Coregonus clupeaformis TaxID=59861 RepID=UPI001BE0F361|nr:retinoblastoma-associated protein [Coregonus clupeaformis]
MPPKKRNSGAAQNKEMKLSIKHASPENPDLTLSIEKHKEKDADFVTLCQSLQVTDAVCDRAWTIWKAVQASVDKVPDTQKRLWGACLFVAVIDLEVASFTFTQIQKAVDLNVKQFLGLLKKMDVNLDTISTKVNSAVTRLEKKYDVSRALYQRFEKTCSKIYAVDSEAKGKEILRSCWTMFLLAKGRALQMEDDLVISFHLMVCVLEFFIRRCPPSLLQPLYQSAISTGQSPPTRTSRRNQSKAKPRQAPQEVDVQLLETLCKENDCSVEEVKSVYQTSFSAFLDSMSLSGTWDLPQATDLNKQYEELYFKSRDFDSRLFLDNDETLLTPKVEPMQVERTPRKNLPEEDVVLIPPQTPVRAAMNSIAQLRVDLTSSGDQPSANLAVYFKNCTVDPTEEVLQRVESLGQLFSQRFGEAVGPRCVGLGKQRFTLGIRLYYRVMESMLKSEEKRLSVQNFSKLLNDSTFHTSLLACALEVVMATYGGSTLKNGGYSNGGVPVETDLCFPWILDVFQLTAFDFYKVIESFIKAEPSLSKDIVKHLERCEHLIMETIAWRADSPLFELLKRTREEGPVEQAEPPATLNQPLQHNHTAADLYLSPVRPSSRPLPAAESTAPPSSQPPTPASHQTPRHPKSNSLSLFYKKLYRLAYMRLKMLYTQLLTSHPELEPIMWTLFQHTLQNEYELMRDRHLDQLMMSAMYAICKVKNVDLRFKTIVTAYKNMPNTNQETFKHVLIREGQYDSIIVFYNLVFMQKLKTNILQYASPRPPTLSPIPHIPRSPYKFPNSPLRVPGSNNVYISPMKSPTRMSPGVMTPRTRILVSIGESFGTSDKFQKINAMVNSSDRSLKRSLDMSSAPNPLKRLRFDVEGQDEADGSKPGEDSRLIQKLAEIGSTRTRMQEQKMKDDAESKKDKP